MKGLIIFFCTVILPLLIIAVGVVISARLAAAVDRRDEDERADIDPYLIRSTERAKYPDSALIRDMHEPVGM